MIVSARRLYVVALVAVLAAGCPGATVEDEAPNAVEIVVDGGPPQVWSIQELMDLRFDWVSPKQQIYPAVRIADLLDRSGLEERDRVSRIRFSGGQDEVVLRGDRVELADRLLLKLDLNRGGVWQLVAEDAATEELVTELQPPRHVRRLTRIEILRASP